MLYIVKTLFSILYIGICKVVFLMYKIITAVWLLFLLGASLGEA